jgi:hypothetical protein
MLRVSKPVPTGPRRWSHWVPLSGEVVPRRVLRLYIATRPCGQSPTDALVWISTHAVGHGKRARPRGPRRSGVELLAREVTFDDMRRSRGLRTLKRSGAFEGFQAKTAHLREPARQPCAAQSGILSRRERRHPAPPRGIPVAIVAIVRRATSSLLETSGFALVFRDIMLGNTRRSKVKSRRAYRTNYFARPGSWATPRLASARENGAPLARRRLR